MSSIKKRIVSGVGANLFAQAVTILIQIGSLPLFLTVWDAQAYGVWIMISAIPAYFAMADAGFVSVASNKMTMLAAKRDFEAVNVVFQSILLLTIIVTFTVWGLTCLFVYSAGTSFELLATDGRKFALVILVLAALMNIYSGLFDAIFRAAESYTSGTYLLNVARLVEWGAGISFLLIAQTIEAVACGYLLGRCVASFVLLAICARKFPAFEWGITRATRQEITVLFKPAISFMAFPLGNSLSIQGVTLIVGNIMGPAFLTVFNTYRTITRIPIQVVSVLNKAVWPEFSKKVGEENFAKLRRLHHAVAMLCLLISLFVAMLLYYAGAEILATWSKGKVEFHASLFLLFLASAVIAGIGQTSLVLLMATNKHMNLAFYYLAAAVVAVFITPILLQSFRGEGGAFVILLFELIITCVSFYQANRLLKRSMSAREVRR